MDAEREELVITEAGMRALDVDFALELVHHGLVTMDEGLALAKASVVEEKAS